MELVLKGYRATDVNSYPEHDQTASRVKDKSQREMGFCQRVFYSLSDFEKNLIVKGWDKPAER